MSEKAEAAQKWAEAKSCLEAADQALASAKEAYAKAEDAEFHAWQALEELAGRVTATPIPEPVREIPRPQEERAFRHSLAQRPIG